MEVQDEKKDANVVQVWNSSALSPHILTLSQFVDVELMQKEGHEKVNLFGEFAEENSSLLVKVPILKRRAKEASITNVKYWGLVCEAQEMVDAKMNSIDVSNIEEDNGVDETRKQMDIWKDETCMVLLYGGTLDQVLDDVVEID